MTGTALSVIAVVQSLIVQNVGEFITRSVSILQTASEMPSLPVQFVRFVKLMLFFFAIYAVITVALPSFACDSSVFACC